jgi:hypothetical protein
MAHEDGLRGFGELGRDGGAADEGHGPGLGESARGEANGQKTEQCK